MQINHCYKPFCIYYFKLYLSFYILITNEQLAHYKGHKGSK
jgi:hypothetical protein